MIATREGLLAMAFVGVLVGCSQTTKIGANDDDQGGTDRLTGGSGPGASGGDASGGTGSGGDAPIGGTGGAPQGGGGGGAVPPGAACAPVGAADSCDTGLPGECAAGQRECEVSGTTATWGACVPLVPAGDRDCGSSLDNDCDGSADQDEPACNRCPVGDFRPCQEHPEDGTGTCQAGTQTCEDLGSELAWSACVGAVGPSTEQCGPSANDTNCDGVRGNGPGCLEEWKVATLDAQHDRFCGPDAENSSQSRAFTHAYGPGESVPSTWDELYRIKLFKTSGPNLVAVRQCAAEWTYISTVRVDWLAFDTACTASDWPSEDIVEDSLIGYASTESLPGYEQLRMVEQEGTTYGSSNMKMPPAFVPASCRRLGSGADYCGCTEYSLGSFGPFYVIQ